MFCAVSKGNIEMMNLVLMNQTVDIDYRDKVSGINAFWLACLCGHGHIMKILAEKGIDVLCSNQEGTNALHLAVTENNIPIVKMLLASRFPIGLENGDGMNILHIAAYQGYFEMLSLILNFIQTSN